MPVTRAEPAANATVELISQSTVNLYRSSEHLIPITRGRKPVAQQQPCLSRPADLAVKVRV